MDALENVQKFALCMCTKQWNSSYNELLHVSDTNCPSLEDRRTQASLCHIFKIMHGETEFVDAPVYQRTSSNNTRSSDRPILYTP